MREIRTFARWLESVRKPRRAEGLATVSWFLLDGDLSLPLLVRAVVEANLSLGRGPAPSIPVTLLHCDNPLAAEALIDEAGRLHAERGDPLHVTVGVPTTGPILIIMTVNNLACDSFSLRLILERLSQQCRYFGGDADSPALGGPNPIPSFAATLPASELADRIEAQRSIVQGAAWLRRADLERAMPAPATGIEAEGYRTATFPLGAELWGHLASQRVRLSATPFIIAVGAWAALLGRLAAAEKVVAVINTTARQVEGFVGEIGFFYDLGVLPVRVRPGQTGEEIVQEARRAIVEHHARYVPCGFLVENVPEVAEALTDPKTLIIALQAKEENRCGGSFGSGRRSAFESIMSHGEAFSLPLDGLMTLTGKNNSFRLELEHRRSSVSDGAANALLVNYANLLTAIVHNPKAGIADRPQLSG